ncbi:MAG: energy-coupling factor ABC transporter ATP-binding protein [Candidatus Limnocylindrales bacterium]
MSGGEAIRCEGLGFRYRDGTRALRGVELRIESATRVAIIGQNGSGKSTLVRQFNGLLRPTEGRVLVHGAEIGRRHVAEMAREVGLAFQNPDRQIFAARVRDEVAFGPRNLGLRGTALVASIDRALGAVGLGDSAEANPYDLGFSKRKLLALASVIAMDTPILVLDEPTTGQDARGVGRIRDVVASVAAEGRTVITITHDMRFAAEAFERVVVMGEGRVLADGTPAEVFGPAMWPILQSTNLEAPLAARLGAAWGLGSTPTEASLVAALEARH